VIFSIALQWKTLLRSDQNLASISTPGRRGRPARTAPSPTCLTDLDGNSLADSLDYTSALAQLEEERTKNAAAKQELELTRRSVSGLQQQIAGLGEENEAVDRCLSSLSRQQQELEREIVMRKDYSGQIEQKLTSKKVLVKELLGVCAGLRNAQEGLSATLASEESKAVVLRRSKARLDAE
jgi:septal ring factor EnvC (AmiA/AmiB activator)